MFGFKRDYLIRVPYELKNSNQGRTHHWSAADKERRAIRLALNLAEVDDSDATYSLHDFLAAAAPDGRQGLLIRRILGPRQRLWDPDSILRGNAKELIDSLVEAGVARDDSPKYLEWVLGLQDDSRREDGPSIEVEVWS